MDREKGDGNTILLTVIGVATLLVALVGATFAYFSAQITNESKQSVNLTTAQPTGLEYLGKDLVLNNIIPGVDSTGSKNEENEDLGQFIVRNPDTSAYAQTYDLSLVIDEDDFVTTDGTDQLFLTITSTSATISNVSNASNATAVSNGLTWNLTDGATVNGQKYQFINDARIEKGQTHTYNMVVEFKELNQSQDSNQGKSFRAHVEISNPVSVQNTTPGP